MGQGHRRKLSAGIVLFMLWLTAVYGRTTFAAELEVDELIESLRNQLLAAEKRARENPLFGVKELKLNISYAIEKKGEGGFKAFVITASGSVSAHAVQTMEIPLAPVRELTVEGPSTQLAKASVPFSISFDPGSSKIPPKYYPELERVGKLFTRPDYQESRVQIEGYTDNSGTERYNQLLSKRRAESVKRYLVEHFFIDPQRIRVKAYGQTKPLASNDTPEGRERNRRVEIVNLGKG